jgi:type 1 glutamine amidotransferase
VTPVRILVFSRTAGYRHESIPAGLTALADLGDANNFAVTATEEVGCFTRDGLRPYAAVVFLNPSGEVFADEHRRAFEEYIRGGGGFVGVHCAANTETTWPFYGDLVGARFTDHPPIQPATLRVDDRGHPATAHLVEAWPRTDEWYNFDHQPRGTARVLLSVDESEYEGGTMGNQHPIAWCYEPRRDARDEQQRSGRAFYTALGHTVECYAEPAIRAHLLGAISWVTQAIDR